MAIRFSNFKKKLEQHCMTMLTKEEEFLKEKIVCFQCPKGHISKLSDTSFNNKTNPKHLQKLKSLCADCNYILEKEEEARVILEQLNFKLLHVEKDPEKCVPIVHFQCNCGNISKSYLNNLKKPTKTSKCIKCLNNDNKLPYDVIKNIFEEKGCLLLTKPEEYINNKHLLDFKCVCGSTSGILLNDIKRGRLCKHCKNTRRLETIRL